MPPYQKQYQLNEKTIQIIHSADNIHMFLYYFGYKMESEK